MKRSAACLTILGLYLGAAFITDPRGEFPLNDDWSFTRTAFRFASEGRMAVDEWCAMSLVGQALYGGLLGKVFGNSFLTLRISTLVLSCLLSIVTWVLLNGLKVPYAAAWIATLTWIFNPIQFALSFTYLTEIPFLFLVAVSALALSSYARTENAWALAGAAAALGYAFLIRQTAVLFLVSLLLALKFRRPGMRSGRVFRTACVPALVFGALAGTYYLWIASVGGITPATQRKFALLKHLTIEQIVSNFFGLLFYTSLMLLPAAVYLAPRLAALRDSAPGAWRMALPAFWGALPAAGLAWFGVRYWTPDYFPSRAYHPRMPYLLNVLYDTGLGPVTLDPTYYGSPATPTYPALWWGITLLVAVGAAVVGLCMSLPLTGRAAGVRGSASTMVSGYLMGAALLIGAFELFFSHMQEGGLFDRHILVVAWPLLISLFSVAGVKRKISTTGGTAASVILLAVLGCFSVTATHDYLEWNRLRWDLGRGLLSRGVDPLRVSGGFEFNGWHNYDVFRSRGNVGTVYYWWYDERLYLIAMAPQVGYEIVERRSYFSWLHRMQVPVYLLREEHRS